MNWRHQHHRVGDGERLSFGIGSWFWDEGSSSTGCSGKPIRRVGLIVVIESGMEGSGFGPGGSNITWPPDSPQLSILDISELKKAINEEDGN